MTEIPISFNWREFPAKLRNYVFYNMQKTMFSTKKLHHTIVLSSRKNGNWAFLNWLLHTSMSWVCCKTYCATNAFEKYPNESRNLLLAEKNTVKFASSLLLKKCLLVCRKLKWCKSKLFTFENCFFMYKRTLLLTSGERKKCHETSIFCFQQIFQHDFFLQFTILSLHVNKLSSKIPFLNVKS